MILDSVQLAVNIDRRKSLERLPFDRDYGLPLYIFSLPSILFCEALKEGSYTNDGKQKLV